MQGLRYQASSSSLPTEGGVAEHGGEASRALPELTQRVQVSGGTPRNIYIYARPVRRLSALCHPQQRRLDRDERPLQAEGEWLLGLSACSAAPFLLLPCLATARLAL